MGTDKRSQIKLRIEKAQARHAERETTFLEDASELASDAKDSFTQFAKAHPLTVVAGGLAVGVLISAMFKGSPTRKLGGKAAGIAAIGAEMALTYAQQALDAAEDAGRAGAEKLEDLGDSVGDTARGLRRDATYYASGASDQARIVARKAGKRLGRAIRHKMN